MSVVSAEEVFSRKQPSRIGDIVTMLEAHGFETRTSNSAHIFYKHKHWPDIHNTMATTATNRSVDVRYQKMAAKDCMKVLERKKTEKLQSSFDAASQNRLDDIRARLPTYISAHLTPNGRIILRDVQVPQIGVTLYSAEEDRLIENKIHNEIEPAKRAFYIEANRLHMQHDAFLHFDDHGTFTGHISHEVYDLDMTKDIPAYQEGGTIADVFTILADLRERIELKDVEQAIRRDALLDRPFIGTIFVTHSEQRGERTNRVAIDTPEKTKGLSLTFHTFSNQRVAGDGSRGRISDKELEKLEWQIGQIEKRLAPREERALRAA